MPLFSALANKTYNNSTTTTDGIATFHLTDSKTSDGNALFSRVYKNTAQFWVEDSANAYWFCDYTLSEDKKTLTIGVKHRSFSGVTILGIEALGSTTSENSPDGTIVRIIIWGD